MNIEGIKAHLAEYFKNGEIEFKSFIDTNPKRINAKITHPDVNVVEVVGLNIFPQENIVKFDLIADNKSIGIICDTYDNMLGIAFMQWFKPILRGIVNGKYELEGDIITDELLGTDYCQLRSDGILIFVNLSEIVELTNA